MHNYKLEREVKKQYWLGEVHQGSEDPYWTIVPSRKRKEEEEEEGGWWLDLVLDKNIRRKTPKFWVRWERIYSSGKRASLFEKVPSLRPLVLRTRVVRKWREINESMRPLRFSQRCCRGFRPFGMRPYIAGSRRCDTLWRLHIQEPRLLGKPRRSEFSCYWWSFVRYQISYMHSV